MTDANSLVALSYRMNLEEAEATEMHLGMRCLLGINKLEKKGGKQGWEEGQACLGEGVKMTALRGHHPPLSVCFHPLKSFGLRHVQGSTCEDPNVANLPAGLMEE